MASARQTIKMTDVQDERDGSRATIPLPTRPGDGHRRAPDSRFEALVFDWDGTAVPDRSADAARVRAALEAAVELGLFAAVVSGTHLGNIDGQLRARPHGPGELHLLLNRGSEVFRCDADGVTLVERRQADAAEDAALDRAAELTIERLREHGLEARVVSQRLNRRKIDLIPLPEWADPPKARIDELLAAVQARLRKSGIESLAAAVAIAERAAADAGLAHARVTSDAKHVEIGLTDKSDSAEWYLAHLWSSGIAPEQVLIAGDELGPLGGFPGSDSKLLVAAAAGATVVSVGVEPTGVPDPVHALGGGPERFAELLERQLELRRARALPLAAGNEHWTLVVDGFEHEHERAHEALLTLADGRLGTRGSLLAPRRASAPGVILAGAYAGHAQRARLQPAPLWNVLPLDDEHPHLRRALDLRTGILTHEIDGEPRAVEFSSLAEPAVAVLRATASRDAVDHSTPLVLPRDVRAEVSEADGVVMRIDLAEGTLEAAAIQRVSGDDDRLTIERVAAYATTDAAETGRPALHRVRRCVAAGGESLLVAHRHAWAQRWEDADVRIAGDPRLQLGVRLALYHLMASTASEGEAAVGARGLTGEGYRGHVFWDSDVFVLPFLAATHPAGARAILEYRLRRLPAAQAAARALGRRGARFAWESAADGSDVTPIEVRDRAGRHVAVYTGQREEHIVADVAWAAACYLDWTGDRSFREGPGRELLVETARYWATRIERDADGSGHIRGVIGPDEYHELVDDNAYTNVMARWNLRRAHAETTDTDVDPTERRTWIELAEALADGYLPERGIYEQFAGFLDLEPLVIAELAPHRPIAADLLLPPARVAGAQIVKQADVLMLHHLVPGELRAGSLDADVAYYEPRTAHGSSLSPGVHASVLARAGHLEKAVTALELTSRVDLDDISDSTAGGVHLAAMGTLWQAIAYGFAGIRAGADALTLDPHVPAHWGELELRLRFRDARLRLTLSPGAVDLWSDRPVAVAIAGAEPVAVGPEGHREELP